MSYTCKTMTLRPPSMERGASFDGLPPVEEGTVSVIRPLSVCRRIFGTG